MPQIDLFNQSEPLWTRSVHEKENNSESQKFLDKRRAVFGGQNRTLYDFMMQGGEADGDVVLTWEPKVRHLPRRVKDITELGFKVSWKWHDYKNLKVYYMSKEDKEYNKILMQSLAQERK